MVTKLQKQPILTRVEMNSSYLMRSFLYTVVVISAVCAVSCGERVNIFDLCGTGLKPNRYVSRTEDLVLEMSGHDWTGYRCKVLIAGDDSDDTLYYRFTRFSVSDLGIYVKLTLKSSYLYSTEDKYSSFNHPDLTEETKGYQKILITLERLSAFDDGLSASVTISNKGGSGIFELPVGTIIAIVIGGVAVFGIGIALVVYFQKRKRQNRPGTVMSSGTTHPAVTYNNTNVTPGVYPMSSYSQPGVYHTQVNYQGYQPYPPPQGYQPQSVSPGYNPAPGQAAQVAQPPAYESLKPSAPSAPSS